MIERTLQAGQLEAKDEWQEMNFRSQIEISIPAYKQQKRPLEGFPRRLPLLQPIRLFRILN
jgi:hypothetical protein